MGLLTPKMIKNTAKVIAIQSFLLFLQHIQSKQIIMKTENAKLSQIKVNSANPRIIKDDKFTKLVNSILVLPKMLEIRPIVVSDTMVALGGNMRYRALMSISDMSADEMKDRLSGVKDFQKKTDAEKDILIKYWERWKDNPIAPILKASDLTDAEQREFIIKDNVGYGEWDFDMLANEWDNAKIDTSVGLYGNVKVYGNAYLSGELDFCEIVEIFGHAQLDGYASINGNTKIGGGTVINFNSIINNDQ